MSNILFQLSHPAHFHFFKNIIGNLKKDGNQVFVLIKTKDILEDLLVESGIEYYNILPNSHRKSKFGLLFDMFVRDWRMMKFISRNKIDLLVGTTAEVAQVGWLMRKPAINAGEDDAAIVPAFMKVAARFIQVHLAPVSCNVGSIEDRVIHYHGFQKLAYLHPSYFSPNKSVVGKYGIEADKPFFILRFALLKAFHDNNVHGIDKNISLKLVELLQKHGNVYLTSERPLEPELEKYRLHINPLDIHHIMSFATMYIGDSQSMAVEAAMLGVPSVRFNDFVGNKKIGVMEELEYKYGLTYGISPSDPNNLYSKIEELLTMPNLREEFQNRRQKMLADKIDVTAFFTWFIENYPESKRIMKENPDYQYRFR